MSTPIPCGHPAHSDGCHHCRLAATVEEYALFWGRPWPPGFEVPPTPPAPAPKPVAGWPRPLRAVARLRRPGDVGPGDTLARAFARLGGEWFKGAFQKLTGFDCGCADRRAWLNSNYPYPTE